MEKKNRETDSDFTFSPVPDSSRKAFLPMFFIMLGFTFTSSSMSVGARLGNGLDLTDFLIAVAAGGAVLSCYVGLLSYIGSDTGLSFDLLARRSFGRRGSLLPSFLIAVTQIGWFGVGAAMFAYPAAGVLHVPPAVLILIAGICMTASAYHGIRGMEIVSYISVPLIVVLGVFSMTAALSGVSGFSDMFAKMSGGTSVITGIGLVIGSFISGGTTTPNFTRFASKRKAAVLSSVIAFFLGNSLMFLFGAVGGAFTGKDDIFYVMTAQGLLLPALFVLGANIWTTNDNALYSAGLGLSNITGVRKAPMVIAAGAAGTLAAGWLYNNFVSWLGFLSATLPPVGAVIISDYFLHRASYKEGKAVEHNVNWGAVTGVIAGALVGSFVHYGISSINAMLTACVCYSVSTFAAHSKDLHSKGRNVSVPAQG